LQLKDDSFDVLFVSPLRRAQQTADIVAAGRDLPATMLPALREIDLYSFQVCVCCCWVRVVAQASEP
jgi:broad specificity phosphatase PhoE